MYKNQIKEMPTYFDRYINYVPDTSIHEALVDFGIGYISQEFPHFERLGDKVYAADKWTIADILQHLIDTERIFAYRALRFARRDMTELPGFDENTFAANAHASTRSCRDLVDEFAVVRIGTTLLFKQLESEDLAYVGTASGNKISTLALGFTMVGHVMHHMSIVKERYYPLINI